MLCRFILDGNDVLGMDLAAGQAAERPSGPPDEAMALVSVLGNCASLEDFRRFS